MKKIMFLPLDERPCNYQLPYSLAKCAKGYKLVRPLKSKLGLKKTPSKFINIKEFLLKNAKDSDIAIISLDQILYGGIVPSRIHHIKIEELRKRLEIIKEIKEINPSLKIYLFALVLRCPCYSTDDEEPMYYGKCGEEIFKYGVLETKLELNLITKEFFETETKPLLKKIGKNLDDFLARRKVNFEIMKELIEKYAKYLTCFVIPQDDSEPYGYAMKDRNKLSKILEENNVEAAMYPGADEVGMVLLARALSDDLNVKPEIMSIWPKEECKNVIPMFEAQPVYKTMQAQLETVGFKLVNASKNKLFMNYPTKKTVNMGWEPNESYAERDLPHFISEICKAVNDGDNVMICDGAYCNGGEEKFLIDIANKINIFKICSYAGWNTSSNAMGTAIAQGMIAILFEHNKYQEYFTAERIIEDIAYCGHVRWDLWHDYAPKHGYCLENVGVKDGIVAKEAKRELNLYIQNYFPDVEKKFIINKCQFPWSRLFEVDLGLKFKK